VATDNSDWDERHAQAPRVFDVQKMEALEAVKAHEADVLIISWPPLDDDRIVDVVKIWGTEKPIIYIGEGAGGCNAPMEFFEHFKQEQDIPIPSWWFIYDSCIVGHWRE